MTNFAAECTTGQPDPFGTRPVCFSSLGRLDSILYTCPLSHKLRVEGISSDTARQQLRTLWLTTLILEER